MALTTLTTIEYTFPVGDDRRQDMLDSAKCRHRLAPDSTYLTVTGVFGVGITDRGVYLDEYYSHRISGIRSLVSSLRFLALFIMLS